MKRERKIDFISRIVTSNLSGVSETNKMIAENVRVKIEKDLNVLIHDNIEKDLDRCNDNYIDVLISMLGYKQIIGK